MSYPPGIEFYSFISFATHRDIALFLCVYVMVIKYCVLLCANIISMRLAYFNISCYNICTLSKFLVLITLCAVYTDPTNMRCVT